jgi:condensin complex subunit 1
MGDQVDFDINNALKYLLNDPATIATPEADGALQDCESDPDSLTSEMVNGILNPIVDSIAENPDSLTRSSTFDSLQFLLKCAPIFLASQHTFPSEPDSELFKLSRSASQLPTHSLSKIFDLIVSGLSSEADAVHNELETDEQDTFKHQKQLLEMYAFLLQWSISAVEVKAAEKPSGAPARGRGTGKGAKAKGTAKDGTWDSSAQLQAALDTMCKVLKLKLGKIFVTTSERDTFVGLFTRPVYLILESEQRIKSTALRMHAFKVLCIAVKHHGHAFGDTKSVRSSNVFADDFYRSANFDNPKSFVLRAPCRTNGRISAHSVRAIRLPSID